MRTQPAQQPSMQMGQNAQLKKMQAQQELKEAVQGANEKLFSATTIFPFTLFPDTLEIDREKLTLTQRAFFRVAEVTSIAIEDILNVTASVGPFFGSVQIATRFFDTRQDYELNFFSRDDAIRIKQIMQGYIITRQKNIDCSAFNPKELREMLEKLGAGVNEP